MKRSEGRILTTHTGSLARPPELRELLVAKDRSEPYDGELLAEQTRQAVRQVVERQASVGLAIINDGEQSKIGFAPYVRDRLEGFDGPGEPRPVPLEMREFPAYFLRRNLSATLPTCNGPVGWKNFAEVERDVANLNAAAVAGT